MKRWLRRNLLYYLLRIAAFIIYILPLRVGLFVGSFLGKAGYYLVRKERIKTLNHLRMAFGGEKSEKEIARIACEAFGNQGKNVVEIVNYPKINKSNIDSLIEAKGLHKFDKVLEKKKGLIIMASHFGNWEFLGAYLCGKGYKGPVVARRIRFDKFDKLLNSLRASKDVEVLYRDESPRKALKILKGGGIIGILADQDVDSVEGVFVDFFGKPAYTPTGPVVLAMTTGAQMVPCFLVRHGNKRKCIVEDPIELEVTGNKERDILVNTEKWSKVLESYIRKYPSQWVWMHRRWKTRPKQNQK